RMSTGDPRFLRIVRLRDAATMQDYLRRSVLDELRDDTEVAIFVTTEHEIRGARRDASPITPEAFAAAADSFVQASLRGDDPTGGMMALNGAAYHVVAIPAKPPEGLAGVLLFGIRITDS